MAKEDEMIRIDPTQMGVDEVGRGAWAGPLVGAAVWIPKKIRIPRTVLLKDSKLLTTKQRERSYDFLMQNSLFSLSIIAVEQIDRLGIQKAHSLLLHNAISDLLVKIKNYSISQFSRELALILIDGRRICSVDFPHKYIEKGDSTYQVISAASIIAKVSRDRIMEKLSAKYPAYLFHHHKGYGTESHSKALFRYGPCDEHRKSYKPVKLASEGYPQRIFKSVI